MTGLDKMFRCDQALHEQQIFGVSALWLFANEYSFRVHNSLQNTKMVCHRGCTTVVAVHDSVGKSYSGATSIAP